MKRKLLKSFGITMVLLAVVVTSVFAFSMGSTDGVWGRIDVGGNPGQIVDVIGAIGDTSAPGGSDQTRNRNNTVCVGDPDGDISFNDWSYSSSFTWTGLGSYTSNCVPTTGLFFSQYGYDARNYTDDYIAIEIFNGTGTAVDLTGYAVRLYTSASAFTLVDLNDVSLANGDVFVLVNSAAAGSTTQEDQTFANSDSYRTVVLVSGYEPDTDGITDGATEDTWATGPARSATNLDVPTTTWADWNDQTPPSDDWNQVRYGTGSSTGFAYQSGFGFLGVENIGASPELNTAFLVGEFCHFNNPITSSNSFEYVPLTLAITNVTCPVDWENEDGDPDNLEFEYIFNLDETSNGAVPCAYGPGDPFWPDDSDPNINGCADRVNVTSSTETAFFKCIYDVPPTYLEANYTISLLGFTTPNTDGTCPATPSGSVSNNVIYTAEGVDNCFCVYGAVTTESITPVVLKDFSATGTEEGVLLSWETTIETNNLGFNLYRSDSIYGVRVLLNQELIMSKVGPGDPFGAIYEYLDQTAISGLAYYYWLEDIPLDGSYLPTSVTGPITGISQAPVWKVFMPVLSTGLRSSDVK